MGAPTLIDKPCAECRHLTNHVCFFCGLHVCEECWLSPDEHKCFWKDRKPLVPYYPVEGP